MKKAEDWVNEILKTTKPHSFDGQIVSVFETYVHVRLRGGNRRLITHVIIADHIDQDKLKPGRYCKVARLHDRGEGQTGRFILTDILPVPTGDDATIAPTAKPDETRLDVSLDCVGAAWAITWAEVQNGISYILYKAQDENGLNQTQVVETTNLNFSMPFVVDGFAFFAVEVVGSNGNSELSDWATDYAYFTDTGIIAFGDNDNHGDILNASTRFYAGDGKVERSTNHGVSRDLITPISVYPDWGEITDLTEIKYTQIITTNEIIFLFGKWENLSMDKQGWFWGSVDNGETWTNYSIRWNLETEGYPIWASLGDTDLFITVWLSGENVLQKYPLSNIAGGPTSEISLGAATLVQVEAKEKWAFPVWATTDEVYVAGRFNSPSDDAIAQIVKFDVGGPAWTDVIDDWGEDVCTALKVEKKDTDVLFYATRETS